MYNKCVKKFLISLFFFFSQIVLAFAQMPEINGLHQYTLENGLTVFILEDSSDALVRVEFNCRAGFSSQSQENSGFFKLYSRLFQAATPNLQFSFTDCNADSSRYVLTTTPSKLADTLETLSASAFSLFYTDELLTTELKKMKTEVSENSQNLASFINAAIDSRIFYEAPWKHDSGIYPSIFKKINNNQARTILKDISDKWYTPQNSALFISGNINPEKLLITLKNTFGKYYSTYRAPVSTLLSDISLQPNNSRSHKFVLHSPDFSSELTQIVVQYTTLQKDQTDLLATCLNEKNSNFKTNVLNLKQLNIIGDEYINVSSANKNNSSRLIFQTLIQPPENNPEITSLNQADLFLREVTQIANQITTAELIQAHEQLILTEKNITANANSAMDYLSQYWTSLPFLHESDCSIQTITQALNAEEPYVFVIINSADYQKNETAYKAYGFEEVTTQNASWYTQQLNQEILDQLKPEDTVHYTLRNSSDYDNNYTLKNKSQISTAKLSNGINVITKQNNFSQYLTILLSIKGGKINSGNNDGFEEAMINILETLIQTEIKTNQEKGLILGFPNVYSKTDLSTSSIIIECETDDFVAVCNSISTSLIYGNIKPAFADRAVASRQYHKRLENGSASNQLQAAAISELFGSNDFSALFSNNDDILLETTYNSILEAYPAFLDSSRYSIILSGNIPETSTEILNKTIGLLSSNTNYELPNVPQMSVPADKTVNVQIKHTFLTDIPADQAGPMPAILVPTTNFIDPVLFVIPTPQKGTKESALLNALLNYIDFSSTENTTLQLPRSTINAAFFTYQNLTYKETASEFFKASVQNLKDSLFAPYTNKAIVQSIKDAWILNQLSKGSTNTGAAELIQKGLELFPADFIPTYYLDEYDFIQNATAEDFQSVLDYLPELPPLRVYSLEGK